MQVMTKQEATLLDKLVELAGGDAQLVERAMRKAAKKSKNGVVLSDVIDYIEKEKETKRKPNGVAAE